MTRLSSIFNFDTLRGSFRPGRAVAAALLLVAAVEAGARWLGPHLRMEESIASFDLWVDHLDRTLQASSADVWFVGNSTLHFGVDAAQVSQLAGCSIGKLTFGSGTLAGQVAMTEHFLRRIRPGPRQVVFFLTQDDLNGAGLRADVSRTYLAYDTWRGFDLGRLFRMDDVRKMLGRRAGEWLARRRSGAAGAQKESTFDGRLTPAAEDYLAQLARGYVFDDSAFAELQRLSRQYGFRAILCWMPVTDVYLRFHDQQGFALSAADVARRVADLCARHEFEFWDCAGLAPERYDLFSDAYHMNVRGRAEFSAHLGHFMRAHPPAGRDPSSDGHGAVCPPDP